MISRVGEDRLVRKHFPSYALVSPYGGWLVTTAISDSVQIRSQPSTVVQLKVKTSTSDSVAVNIFLQGKTKPKSQLSPRLKKEYYCRSWALGMKFALATLSMFTDIVVFKATVTLQSWQAADVPAPGVSTQRRAVKGTVSYRTRGFTYHMGPEWRRQLSCHLKQLCAAQQKWALPLHLPHFFTKPKKFQNLPI